MMANKSLSHGSIELYLRCHNFTTIGWGKQEAFSGCHSLLRVDLLGCPKLENIPDCAFGDCHHLVSVVFGEHSNISNFGYGAIHQCFALTSITLPNKLEVIEKLTFAKCTSLKHVVWNKNLKTIGAGAFQQCSALKKITLPDKLEIIEELTFAECTSLKRVVCNKNLKTIDYCAFKSCSKLEDVQLTSSSISFVDEPFSGCDHLIELADAAGFPSNRIITLDSAGETYNVGDGVEPYLIDRFERIERPKQERSERKRYILLALMRFKNAVHTHDGTEEEKVATAKLYHPRPPSMPHPACFTCKAKRRPTRTLRL